MDRKEYDPAEESTAGGGEVLPEPDSDTIDVQRQYPLESKEDPQRLRIEWDYGDNADDDAWFIAHTPGSFVSLDERM